MPPNGSIAHPTQRARFSPVLRFFLTPHTRRGTLFLFNGIHQMPPHTGHRPKLATGSRGGLVV